jgi:DHA1 family inner membrane transport protein
MTIGGAPQAGLGGLATKLAIFAMAIGAFGIGTGEFAQPRREPADHRA